MLACGSMKCCLMSIVVLVAVGAANGQVVITEIMHSPGGSDSLWEWIEVRNITGAPVDLNNWVFDDDDDPSLAAANISSADGTRNTIVPAGGVAVLYAADELDFMPQRFTGAWASGITMIGVDGLTSLTATDAVGLWSSHEMYLDDAIPGATGSPRRTFASAIASVDYSSGFPEVESGHSLAWKGTGSLASGNNWVQSQNGSRGAFVSKETTIDGAQINSTNDRGNPGAIPNGPIASGLRITEIMFAPQSPLATVGYAEADFEWVEIYNNTGSPINFDASGYVFDDNSGSKLTLPNINSGTLDVGEIGILFNRARLDEEDMQAIWGDDLNFIPVTQWPLLNNSPDTIAIWDSIGDYNAEPVTGTGRTHQNAAAAVEYKTTAAAGWYPINNESSIWMTNLSGDPNMGANWLRAGMPGDTLSRVAQPIYATLIDHEGGDTGSPGYVPGAPIATLPGDFNNDNRVDAEDYVVWRKTDGAPAKYSEWRANFGASGTGGGSHAELIAAPEPVAAMQLAAGCACLLTGRMALRRRAVRDAAHG
jgi:hypothetical protein